MARNDVGAAPAWHEHAARRLRAECVQRAHIAAWQHQPHKEQSMPDKPPTTDPEQRRRDTERSRHQSGLPPEPVERQKPEPKRPRKQPDEQKKPSARE